METKVTDVINKQRLIADAIHKHIKEDLSLLPRDRLEIFIAIYQEVNKDLRMDRISFEKLRGQATNYQKNAEEPATIKQRDAMDKFKIKYADNITKKEAHTLIGNKIKEIGGSE